MQSSLDSVKNRIAKLWEYIFKTFHINTNVPRLDSLHYKGVFFHLI